jgi:gamma-tubulin complex component 3
VDLPLNAIFTSAAMTKYLKIFNLLWRIKRVEYSLCNTWRKHTNEAHLSISRKMASVVHKSHIIRNEMLHLVNNLEYYILFEVIESSWENFLQHVKSSQDLDQLIEAHNNYLDTITEKCLLTSADLIEDLVKLLDVVIRFSKSQDIFYVYALQETSNMNSKLSTLKEQEISEKYNLQRANVTISNRNSSIELPHDWNSQIYSISEEYTKLFHSLMSRLSRHSEDKLQSLQFRLDFNDFYDRSRQSV